MVRYKTSKKKTVLQKILTTYKEKGLRFLIFDYILRTIIFFFGYYFFKFFKPPKIFIFNQKKLKYAHFKYNYTWNNERAVEIPIIIDYIKENKEKDILEFGNVLAHYYPINHDVLDKYEKGKNIINEDIIAYDSKKKYDLIVSISTLEHVGFDELPKDPNKILKAIKNMKKMLKKEGKMVLTLPIKYNPHLDKHINDKNIIFDEEYILKRKTWDNLWFQTDTSSLKNLRYGKPYIGANAIRIVIINKR